MKKVVCTIIKDEHKFLKEWIDHNLSIGFDHIYLFEDYGSLSHQAITDAYEQVTLFRISNFDLEIPKGGSARQAAMYTHVLTNMRDIGDWCAFIDVDEYIAFENGYSLNKILEDCGDNEALYLYWKTMGANGNLESQKEIVSSYTKEGVCLKIDLPWQGKSIVNLKTCKSKGYNIHFCENGVTTLGLKTHRVKCMSHAWINHYFTKSWEDWFNQILYRGDASRGHRKIEDFFEVNPEMKKEECYKFSFYKEGISRSFKTDEMVSVCMVTRNRAHLIEKAIWSIIGQTYENLELIIVNDGSTDGTKELLEHYSKIDDRIRVFNVEHNYINSRNKAYFEAKGDYIANMDDDDIRDIDSIEQQYKYIKKKGIDGCGTLIHGHKNEWDNLDDETSEEIMNTYKKQYYVSLIGGTMMFSKAILDKFKNNEYFLKAFNDGGEDTAFIIYSILSGCNFQKLQAELYHYIYDRHKKENVFHHTKFKELIELSNQDGDKFFELIKKEYNK